MSDACSGALSNPGLAPPPPPPPPAAGQVPALRISTASELGPRRAAGPQEAYEPPAAIQNAMMTKDKKPFTYTPGMGGKLDLSQIRSPRMARRVAKNANDEGIDGPPKVLDQQPDGPALAQPSLYYQPQVAVAVFPQGQQPTLQLRNSCLPRNPLAAGGEQQAARPTVRLECSPPQQQQQTPTPPMSPTQVTLAKAPTPWMQKQAQRPQQLPEWAKRGNANRSQDSSSGSDSPQPRQQQPSVPLRIEDRPSVFTAINEPGHHQFVNSNPHHMSRWGNPVGQSAYQPPSQSAYIVPVQVQSCSAPHNNHGNANAASSLQPEPGPVQSQSFRVLQKITDTYPEQAEAEQLRKLQLTEDDRYLMNAFKEQVDGQQYLHQEEDPRYRGAAIPSRAFRYLQTMTDSADAPNAHSTSRPVNSAAKKPNRHSNTFEQVPLQPYIPASQQQVPEPKKYTGAAIPSRSFRILQQMTTPESIGPDVTDY